MDEAPTTGLVPGTMLDEAGVRAAPSTVVVQEAWCARCGYDLRGLELDGICPECAAAVRPSVEGARLVGADPAWVSTLSRGAMLLSVAAVFQVLSWGANVCATVINWVTPGLTSATQATITGVLWLLSALIGLVALVPLLIGWWMVTTADPVRRAGRASDKPRQITRVGVMLTAGAAPALACVVVAIGLLGGSVGMVVAVIGLMGAALVMLTGTGLLYFGGLVHLKRLSARVPSHIAERWCTRMLWLGPLLMLTSPCIFIGPMVAWGLFWMMIERVRHALNSVRRAHRSGVEPGVRA